MQLISIYDEDNILDKTLEKLSDWFQENDFVLTKTIHKKSQLVSSLKKEKPNGLILVLNSSDGLWYQWLRGIINRFLGIKIIVIRADKSYESVRTCFLCGVFDFLGLPLQVEQLKESLLRLYDTFGLNYVVNDLQMKSNALIDTIFSGGGQEEFIIRTIVNQIYEDWKEDALDCQVICQKAKNQIYKTLIDRKPWLDKFLYRKDFTYQDRFSLMGKADVIQEWVRCFHGASHMVKKYQMIDDKLVYRIGKYVVVHVDEKLTLQNVAEGVFLNPSYVSHIFKKTTGISFIDFMIEVKVDRAKVLLRDPNQKIYDVAATIGYGNPEYFAKTFKKKTGYSPVLYQKMLVEAYSEQ